MLAKRKHGIFTAHARNRNGSGLVDLGNLRHGNGGKTLTCCSVPTQRGRGTRDADWEVSRAARVHGGRGKMVRFDKPVPYRYCRPLLIRPLPASAQALHTCSSPSARRSIRGFQGSRYVGTLNMVLYLQEQSLVGGLRYTCAT